MITQSTDGKVTFIQVHGDYLFDDYLKVGSDAVEGLYSFLSDRLTSGKVIKGLNAIGCTAISVRNRSGGFIAGRNMDYRPCRVGVVMTSPHNGHRSVSTVDLSMFVEMDEGLSEMLEDTRLEAVPYLPMDGINDRGVFVCINAVNNGRYVEQHDPDKVTIFTTTALRLILDHAGSTEEAVELLSRYNLRSRTARHLFIADRDGDSRVVEYIDGRMCVRSMDAITNHYHTRDNMVPATENSLSRLRRVMSMMESMGPVDMDGAKDILASVRQDSDDGIHYTRWTVLYDLETLSARLHIRDGEDMAYGSGYSYSLI